MAVAGIGQPHRTLDAGQQTDGVGAAFLAGQRNRLGRGGLLALGALAAGGGINGKGDIVETGHAEVRVETNAERQRLITGVGDGQSQRGGIANQRVAHGQGKIKRIDKFC